jgi:serine/threonine-protein kinase
MREGALIAGKYRLRRLIGEGAAGEVWSALNERTEREVALKVIVGADRELKERAVREARACGRVNHRNVVEILDAGETEQGDPFLAMQLLEGETLGERMKRERRILPPKAAAIALDVARGLGAAHAAGIVHRDLKPSNIFLHREQETGLDLIKVLDFGVSKMLWSGGPPTTRTGDIVGSPAYMSPEQARADRAVDQRTDLWSLGVVMFEMIAGDRPFPSRNIAVISEIVSRPVPSLTTLHPDIDPRLAAVVARCLERDIDRRVQTAQELAALLRPLAAAEDTWGSNDSWRKPQAPPPQEEDLIPTLALGPSDVPGALAAALAAAAPPDAPPHDAPPSSRPFRPVPTTLVDRSHPAPGTNPAAPPQPSRLESPSAMHPALLQTARLESPSALHPSLAHQQTSRLESPSAAIVVRGSVLSATSEAPGYRGPLTTQDEVDDELSTAEMLPRAGQPPRPPGAAPPLAGAPAPPGAELPAGPAGAPPGALAKLGLKKGDATLFLVGVTSALTILALVLAAIGIGRLMSSPKDAPSPGSSTGAATGAERAP